MAPMTPNPAQERLAPGTAFDLLRAAEWLHPGWDDACPLCERKKRHGHRSDCLLGMAIDALGTIQPPPDRVAV